MNANECRAVPVRSRPALSMSVLSLLAFPLLAFPSLALLATPSGGSAQQWERAEARLRAEELRRLSEEQTAEVRLRAQEARLHAEEIRLLSEEQAGQARLRAEELRHLSQAQAVEARAQAEHLRHLLQEQSRQMRVQARDVARDLQQVVIRTRARVRMGVELDPDQGPEYDRHGVRVKGVMAGSPADEAGLLKDDILTHLNRRSLLEPLTDPERESRLNRDESIPVQRLMELVGDVERGDEVEVRFLRDGRQETVAFEVEDLGGRTGVTVLPQDFWAREGNLSIPEMRFDSLREGIFRLHPEVRLDSLREGIFHLYPQARLDSIRGGALRGFAFGGPDGSVMNVFYGRTVRGLELRDLNPDLAPYFSTDKGVLVLDVDDDRALGLRPGDVILAIGDREVESAGDVRRILSSYREEEVVTFQVMRQGRQVHVEGRMD